jgi:hypothetical protein
MRPLGLTIALLVGGCGSGSSGHCPSNGIVLLSWTVQKQPPTADQGCKGIDSLGVELHSDCTVVSIEPIPCINGARWEYDQLPSGENLVILYALDAHKNILAQGEAPATLDSTVPATPTPIDLE